MSLLISKLPQSAVFKLPSRQCTEDEIEVYKVIKEGGLTERKVLRLVAQHYDALPFLLIMIPLPMWVILHQKYNLLDTYYHQRLIEELFLINRSYLYINIKSNNKVQDCAIKLNNCLNMKYNFSDKVFQKRLNILKDTIKKINLDDFILGEDAVTYLSVPEQPGNVILTIYPMTKSVKWGEPLPIQDIGEYYLIKLDGFTFKINCIQTINPEMLLLDTGAICVVSTGDILCTPEFYHSLSQQNDLVWEDGSIELENTTKHYGVRLNSKNKAHSTEMINKTVNICYNSNCKQLFCLARSVQEYPDMCYDCGVINYQKRIDKEDLSGKTAYVSGCRIKIGYYTVLKLLRCGANVIGSTRFPGLALYNYTREDDYQEWKDRLRVIRCDFTNFTDVSNMINFLKKEKLDILINNACQTVKPTQLYLDKCYQLEEQLQALEGRKAICSPIKRCDEHTEIVMFMGKNNIRLNQFKDIFDPTMMNDSSWYKTIDQLDMEEIVNVNVINQMVPTMLVNQLLPTMQEECKVIIMVTAIEGQFNKKKNKGVHPHTNMCKAGINMMVRTLGNTNDPSLNIYAVDPGFVSSVNPYKKRYPLKSEDGASRILDPVFQLYRGNPIKSGLKLKDYLESPW